MGAAIDVIEFAIRVMKAHQFPNLADSSKSMVYRRLIDIMIGSDFNKGSQEWFAANHYCLLILV
jgi:hypothetical protein